MGSISTAEPLAVPVGHGVDLGGRPSSLRQLVRDSIAARDLLAMLARKDFFVRYRRASLGLLWAVFMPIIQAAVLAGVFSLAFKVRQHSYPVYVYSGIVGWTFLQGTLLPGSTAIVDNTSLASKIYFPRALLPLAVLGSNLYGLAINCAVLLVMMPIFGVVPGPRTLLLVPAVVLGTLLVAVATLTLSAAHVYFRDIRYLVQAVILVLFYLTPIIYPLTKVPSGIRPVIWANPATGVVELLHAATVGANTGWQFAVLASCGWILVLGVAAVRLHVRFDRLFTDLL